ncbi:MAG: hypothetical protein R3D43_02105 [Tepidamorphaceae bacterium]
MRAEQEDDGVGFADQFLEPVAPFLGWQDVVGVAEDAEVASLRTCENRWAFSRSLRE